MDEQYSFDDIDELLVRLARDTQDLSQKKNQIIQQTKVCKDGIAERRSHIETTRKKIQEFVNEIGLKQGKVMQIKSKSNSTKASVNLLLEYEQMLKSELESLKVIYSQEMNVYAERIASSTKTLQSHQEYFYQHPQAVILLRLQNEKEKIECRIKSCGNKITVKQMELDHLTGLAVRSLSTEKEPDSVSRQHPIKEPEKQSDAQAGEGNESALDICSVRPNQRKIPTSHKSIVMANAGDTERRQTVLEGATCSPYPEQASDQLWSDEKFDEQSYEDEIPIDELGDEDELEDRALEEQSTVLAVEEEEEDNVDKSTDEDQTPSDENNEDFAPFAKSSSQETLRQLSPPKPKAMAAPSTPTFKFNFSPTSSPCQTSSDTTHSVFQFTMNSGPSTPGFSGFPFEAGTSQDEDSTFPFNGSSFNKKKTTESESDSSSCLGFLFAPSEQSEDFHFTFIPKSPHPSTDTDDNKEDPFSFNF